MLDLLVYWPVNKWNQMNVLDWLENMMDSPVTIVSLDLMVNSFVALQLEMVIDTDLSMALVKSKLLHLLKKIQNLKKKNKK